MSVRTYRVSREGDRLLSPHFRVREFACRDGSDPVSYTHLTLPTTPYV